jgi:hypothetical protein
MVSGNMPVFQAYSGTFSIGTNTWTNGVFGTKQFDTAGAFNNTGSTTTLNGISVPAYAFAPPVAGYYQVDMSIRNQIINNTDVLNIALYKNGSAYLNFYYASAIGNSVSYAQATSSVIVYLNGTSDYIQFYSLSTSSTNLYQGVFSGAMVRTA